jgi:hypothetical protein
MRSKVGMGDYYQNGTSLIRTVCRAFDSETGNPMIAYVKVTDGYASDVQILPEDKFISKFIV